jgi:hypothetical protein
LLLDRLVVAQEGAQCLATVRQFIAGPSGWSEVLECPPAIVWS